MNEPLKAKLANDILENYQALGDTLRLTALPNWISAQLNLSQLKAMFLLEYHGALTISELAKKLELGNSAASILVQQMVEQELVERSEDLKDRRRAIVRLTVSGANLVAGRRENIRINLMPWLSQMGEEELGALQRGLEALVKIMRAAEVHETQSAAPGKMPTRGG